MAVRIGSLESLRELLKKRWRMWLFLRELAGPNCWPVRATRRLGGENVGVVWARLKEGVSVARAAQRLSLLEMRFQENASSLYRESNDLNRFPFEVVPVQEV